MTHSNTAAVIVVGNEVLSGKVPESNAVFLVRELHGLGVALRAIHVIPDELDVIAETVSAASRAVAHVFTTGGVGPTHDDVTLPAIARGLGRDLVECEEMTAVLRHFYPDGLNEHVMRMAMLPRGARLLRDNGLEFPAVAVENIYVFPGDPKLMQRKFTAIRERFRSTPFTMRRLYTSCDEGPIAALMEEAQGRFPEVQVGSYPVYDNPEYRVLIALESRNAGQVEDVFQYLRTRLPPGALVWED
ncbi:MAG: competence/damage-inducible protein A [candidate division NC10 bacterium]|nr:competence/damage-inducible protein A [candidate division NC10 bacterium]